MLRKWLSRRRPPRAARVAPHAEWLEQRLLYSADAASLLGVDTAIAPAPQERSLDASFEYQPQDTTAATARDVRSAFALTPLQFEGDAGQLGDGVDFAASGLGYGVRLGGGNAELLLEGAQQPVTLTLVGAQPGAAEGQDPLATRSNYLVGTDSSQWITDIANYGSVLYRGVYDGVDVRYYGNQQQLEYDFVVAAGADASQLQLRFDGVDGARLDTHGDLLLRVAGTDRDLRFQAPVSYQDGPAGREAVQSRYTLQPDGTVRIVVGDYDPTRALVVDPVLAHASYFGEGGSETALGVAVGADGSVYVTGHTTSTTGSFGTRMALGADASESYVAKFNADLTSLVYATRVGGSGADFGTAIAVDVAGNAIVTGSTRSTDFIVTNGADQAARNGNQQDAFVYKLNAAGNGLVFSTYFGGAGDNDIGQGVALDAAGNVYVAGTVSGASDNAFLNKYTAAGASVYKLEYGGSGADGATGLALDAAGNAYIAGNTLSVDNVTLDGAQVTRPGADDAFLAKYDGAGVLTYATYIGAGKGDVATGLAVDDGGRAYVVGRTKDPSTSGFATTAGAFATTAYTHETGFLRVYDTTLAGADSLQYSSFVGGSRDASGSQSSQLTDSPTGVAVSGGKVVVVGHTDASDLPTTSDAYSRTNTSGDTGFALVLAPQGGGTRDLVYGSYFGTGLATGGVAWSGSSFYLAGSTANGSGNLATTDGWKTTSGGGTEGVVARFSGFTNVAPMLTGANGLAGQLEDVPAAGTLVSDLLAGQFSDGDAGTLAGIAVTGFDASHGSWQFSLDGGGTWTTLAAPAAGSALLLDAGALTRVRFVPAADYAGSSSITFRAWDGSSGTAGTMAGVSATGGSSAFSIGEASAFVTVAAVNDAPVRTAGSTNGVTVAEGSAAVSLGLGGVAYAPGGGSDEAGQTLRVVVTGLPAGVGSIQLADGTAVVAGQGYSVADLQGMRFLPGRSGSGSFTFTVQDSGGTADGGSDSLVESVALTVTNTAPVLTASSVALPPQLEDVPGNGVAVADLVAGRVTDGGGPYGIAVVGMPGGNLNGAWTYSLDGGLTWRALGGNVFSSRLLGPDARIRFESDAGENINGNIPGFTFRAWDGSSGVSGGTAFTFSTGGSSAFSATSASVSLAITPVNDAPVRYDTGAGTFLAAPPDVTVDEGSGTSALGLGYLQYAAGTAADEAGVQTLSYKVTGVPGALGTVFLADGVTTVRAGNSYTLAQIQGMRFRPAAGVQAGTATLAWSVKDNGGTANGGVDTLVDQVSITVRNVAPTLAGANAFPAIVEDAQSAGMLVSDLIAGQFADPANLPGIAVTAADGAGGGTWQWSRDGGGAWNSLAGASASDAVLLQAGGQWRVRFLPDADWNSDLAASAPSLGLRAWDRSTGTAGGTADTTVNGGSSAFSAQLATASITVTAVSDAPVRIDVANNAALAPLQVLDGSPLASLGLAGVTFGPGGAADEASQVVSTTVRITSLPSSLGTVWLADGSTQVVVNQAYTLAQLQGMQFLSSGVGQLGTASFAFTVTDSGSTANGGSNTATFTMKVIVNRAPVLTGANSPLAVEEDFAGTGNVPKGSVPPWATPAQRAGVSVADLVAGGMIVDTTASTPGIAIVGATGSGTWQYSLNGGADWLNLPTVSNDACLLLSADASTRVRFIPDADWNSAIGPTGLTFRAWDQTTGTAGQLGDATYNGGASAYSAATATSTVAVTPINDAPAALDPVGGTVVEGAPPAPILVSGGYGAGPATASDESSQAVTVTFPSGLPAGVSLYLADGVTPVNPAGSYTLAQFMGMKFASAAQATPGTFQLSFQLRDNGGTATGGVDRASFTLALAVTNKAPVLAGANPMAGLQEDTSDNGTLVGDLLASQVSDPSFARGIAVTAVDNSHGSWQYTRDGGTTWTAFGSPTSDAARLLLADSTTRVRFVPAADWNGTATLGFAAWDGTSGTAGSVASTAGSGGSSAFSSNTATTSIVVSPVNDAPVGAAPGGVTVAEDSGSVSLGLGGASYAPGGGGDEAGQVLTVTVTALPPAGFGRVTLADGTDVTLRSYTLDELRGMRFVAAANANGSGSFGFAVRDDGGGTDTLLQTVAITIAPVNDAPRAGSDLLTATEDTPLTLAPSTLLANDSDVDGDTLTVTAVASGTGGTVVLANGNIVFTPDADFNGAAGFSYTVSDGHGGTSITGVVVNVAAVNDAPRLAPDTVAGTEDQVLVIPASALLGNDSDVDGDAFTITAVSGAAGGTVTLSGGNVVFTPAADFNGGGGFSYTVTDASGATATTSVTVDIAAVNDAPVANTETLATDEDTPLTIAPPTLLANDTDAEGDTLTVSAVANGSGGTVALVDGNVVFTPERDFNGTASFSYTVSDGKGGSANVTVSVAVAPANDAPVANDDFATGPLGIDINLDAGTLLANDSDAEGDTLTITGVGGAANGVVSMVGNTILFIPNPLFSGAASFTYSVSDGHGGTATGTVHINVQVGNAAPVTGTDSATTDEDQPLVLDAATLLANDSDANPGDVLSVTGVTALAGGSVSLSGSTITFTPAPDFNGAARFSYTVSDGRGGTATGTVNVNVLPLNDPPRVADDTLAGTEDQPLTIAPGTLLGNDRDVENDALAITGVGAASGGSVALVNGNIVFTPDADFNGPARFTYTASDAQGATATATVTVNVAAVNDAPVANADTLATNEDAPLTIAEGELLANDSDAENDPLAIVAVASGTGGTVTRAGGSVVFTPDANFDGAGSFSYTVSDGQGGTATVAVTVNVAPVNDAPVARDESLSGTEDQVLTLLPGTLLANDTDVDGDALAVTGVGAANGGTVQLAGGNIVFTPTPDFHGPAGFSYTISDGKGGTATATVTLEVAAVNDAPVATADTLDGTEDQPLAVTAASLVANDGDVDGDTLAITGVANAIGGTVSLANGGIVFTPAADFHGSGSFTYTVSDGQGGTATGTVTVNVASVNDEPVAAGHAVQTAEDTPVTLAPATLLANASDADGDTLVVTGVADGVGGTVRIVGGNVVFTPAADFNGPARFSYTVSDGQGGSATAIVTVDVTPVNDAPVAGEDAVSGTEDTAVVLAPGELLANDGDADGDALAVVGVGNASGGSVAISGGSIVFTPDADFNGAGSFTYTVSDGHGGTTTAAVRVDVAARNDAPLAHADVVTATEDVPLTLLPGTLLANDTDVEGEPLVITGVGNATGGTVRLSGGSVVFTPDPDFDGTGSFTYTIADSQGAEATATVTVDVMPVNDAPAGRDDALATQEDTPLTIAPGLLSGNDSDVDGDALRLESVAAGSGGVVELSGGTLTFTPDPDFSGRATFSYVVGDGNGGTATVNVVVDVAPVNDVPVAQAGTAASDEGGAVSGQVQATDADAGDSLGYALVGGASHGTVTLNADGTFTYRHDGSENFADAFTFQVTDAAGATSQSTVSITITPVDDATVTAPDGAQLAEDGGSVAGNVLANDRDADSALAIAGFRIAGADYAPGTEVTLRSVGTLALAADGTWTYAPVADWSGTVPEITYTTTTGATGVLTITVTPVNDAPVRSGTPADLAVFEGDVASLGFAGVSYNPGGGPDEAGQALTVRVTALPAGLGTIELADGTRVVTGGSYTVAQLQGMVFRAGAGVSGSATFGFTVSDGTDAIAEALAVRVANVAPLLDGANALPALDEDATSNAGMSVRDLLAGHASDPGGQVGIAVFGAASSAGQWQFSRDGGAHWSAFEGVGAASAELLHADAGTRIRFVPKADWNGTATGLAFRAWDGTGGTDGATRGDTTATGGSTPFSAATAAASVTVAPVNDAPLALGTQPAAIAVDPAEGGRTLDELAWTFGAGGGGDEAGQALTVTITRLPATALGQLVLADGSTRVVLGGTYTLEQLQDLRFVPAVGTGGGTAEVAWVVSDDGGTARGGVDQTAGSVEIVVEAQAPSTPTPATAPTAPAAPPAEPAPQAATPPAQATPAPVPAAGTAHPGGELAGGDALLGASAPAVLMPPATEFAFAPRHGVDASETARILGAAPRGLADLQLAGFAAPDGSEFRITGLNTSDLGGSRITLEEFQQSLRGGVFIDELNRLRKELRQEFDLDKTLSISVAGVSLGVSVVYVLWLVRGGVLLGSYLSALPAWRVLDPLPVLARTGEEAEEDEDEAFDPDAPGRADPLRGFP